MKLFFDTEFTGLRKDTTIISIGIVSENGKRFYAEFTDYDIKQCDDFIVANVLRNRRLNPFFAHSNDLGKRRKMESSGWEFSAMPTIPRGYGALVYSIKRESASGVTEVCGESWWVTAHLREWLAQFDDVQFVSDVCHYDFVLLIDLFGDAWDLPQNVNPACHDINQDIARHYGISEREAFDKSREEIVAELCGETIIGEKHNALYDAEVIKAIYEELSSLGQ